MKFVSLHHHSTYSFMDGYGSPAAHVERAAELGMSALALTEHGNVSSHPQLEKAARKASIRPIFGLEAYTALDPKASRKFHLTLLAMNAEGYRNLMRIVTESWQNFYKWPTVSGALLAKYHEGLIVLSGCSDSLLACSLLGGKTIETWEASYERAKDTAAKFRALLGDRFYLECQVFPELERTRIINAAYERMGEELSIALVATCDVHYPRPEDNEIQVILHAAGRGAGSVAAQEATWEYDIRLTHPISDRIAFDRLSAAGLSRRAAAGACATTAEIAARCDVELPKAERFRFPTDDSEALIWDLLRKGWAYRVQRGNRRMVERKAEYVERLHHEMRLVASKDFVDYFLLCSDSLSWAKDNRIAIGPGRGSSASSLVCYLLRITEIDPVPLPLMRFERFIDPSRQDLPDIDTDFDDSTRWRMRARLVEQYGADRVGNIANYTRYKGKTAVNDVARVYQIPFADTQAVKSMIVERSGGDSRDDFALQDTIDMFPQVAEVFRRHPDLAKAVRLEGNYRGMSTHAAGLVVSSSPIADVCGMYTRENKVDGEIVVGTAVSVDKKDAEYLGLMKLDFLGLSTMGMIATAIEMAGMTLEDVYGLPLDDEKTLRAFAKNDVVGIFQFEGRATRLVNREVKPEDFLELIHINALSRPGPLFSGTTAEYIEVKNGKTAVPSFHPIIDEITAGTRGAILYQEQILRALLEFGGLSVTRVHEIRRIISQKLGEAQFNTSAEDFATRAGELHGVSHELAMKVWGRVVTSASYAFVYAHSACYALIGYWAQWLKQHHPLAFYTAQLRKTPKEDWARLIRDAGQHGVDVRGVTPGLSGRTWEIRLPEPDAPYYDAGIVVAGWEQLNGVGAITAGRITDYDAALRRARGSGIVSAEELLEVSGIGPVTYEKFRGQIETEDPFGLDAVKRSLAAVRSALRSRTIPLLSPTVTSDGILDVKGGAKIIWVGLAKKKEYKDYLEDERARTGKSIEEIRAAMKSPNLPTSCVLHCYDDGEEDVYVRVTRFDYPKFRDGLERLRLGRDVLWVRARKSRGGFGASLYVEDLIIIDPED